MDLEKKQISEQLDRIILSEEFRGKPVMTRLLSYVVTECISGRADHLKGYSIGVDVFGRGAGFDPNRDAVVRNSAGRLRGLLKTYYLGEGGKDPVIIDIPKGRYVPRFTPNTIADNAARVRGPANDPGLASVGVLPFRNLSSDPDLEFLSIGFSQALSDALTKYDDLQVIGIGHRDDGEVSAGKVLGRGVDFLILGDLQLGGAQVRISYRLVSASDRSHLWGDSFKFDVRQDDLFELQEKITERIASLIGGEYGYINQSRYAAILDSRPRSASEQQVVLQMYYLVTVMSEESMAQFHQTITEALEGDPKSALLNACAGGFYGTIASLGGEGADEALQKFAHFAELAYTLNPNHQWVVGTLATKCFMFDERERFFTLFEQYQENLACSPLRLGSWAMYMCLFGEWEHGKKLLDQVMRNNMNVPLWLYGITYLYDFRLRDYESALVEANKIQIPGLFWGPFYRTAVLGQLGRVSEAKKEFEALLQCCPDFVDSGRSLVRNYVKESSLLDQLIEGIGKIGVTIA